MRVLIVTFALIATAYSLCIVEGKRYKENEKWIGELIGNLVYQCKKGKHGWEPEVVECIHHGNIKKEENEVDKGFILIKQCKKGKYGWKSEVVECQEMQPLLFLIPSVTADPFWMTADLLRVDWNEGCLTTAGCSHPRFEILGDLLPFTEEISISWPISEHFVQDTSRSFVSHWTKGKPEDLTLKCQVVGTDPLYGFPRVCDHTALIRAFPDRIDEVLERKRRQATTTTTLMPEEELGKRLIEIRDRCFNATIAVEKHIERCPWCPDPSDVALIEQRQPDDPLPAFSTSIFSRLKSDDKILHASVLILAGISILTPMSFACALVALLRQKRSHRQITVKTRCQPYYSSSSKTSEEENRYDMPWEQTLPLTYCLSSSSKSTTTSPLDSTSSFSASSSTNNPYSFRPGSTLPQTQIYQHISKNSSTTVGRDSGHGSV